MERSKMGFTLQSEAWEVRARGFVRGPCGEEKQGVRLSCCCFFWIWA